MFGMGLGEIILIAGLALILLGPDRFPEVAKVVVRTMRDLRGYLDEVKTEITREIKPVNDEIRHLSRYDAETYLDALAPKKTDAKKTGGADSGEGREPAGEEARYEYGGYDPGKSADFGEDDEAADAPAAAEEERPRDAAPEPAPEPGPDSGEAPRA